MKRDYLGDSYDAVKRLWQQIFADWAPLHAERRFVPEDLHQEFTQLTGIPVLPDTHPAKFSILNDPDVGIRLPGEENQAERRTHISTATIVRQLRWVGVCCVVTFDQSVYRNSGLKQIEQRRAKLRHLETSGVFAFYYVSHAPFLFAFSRREHLEELLGRLLRAGIPENRFQSE